MFEDSILRVLERKHRKSHGTLVCEPASQARVYRCNHPDVIDVLHKLGNVCMKQKEFAASMEYYIEAVSRQNQLKTPTQKLQLAEGAFMFECTCTVHLHNSIRPCTVHVLV